MAPDSVKAKAVLEIQSTRESFTIIGPSTAVGKEVLGLNGTIRKIGKSDMISTTDQTRVGRTKALGVEGGTLVGDAYYVENQKNPPVRIKSENPKVANVFLWFSKEETSNNLQSP